MHFQSRVNSLKSTDFDGFLDYRKKFWNEPFSKIWNYMNMKVWTEPKISFLSEGDPTDVTFERSFTLNAILIPKIYHFWPITSEFLSIHWDPGLNRLKSSADEHIGLLTYLYVIVYGRCSDSAQHKLSRTLRM